MKLALVSPESNKGTSGNSITARRWANMLSALGHDALITAEWAGEDCDVLIALHARRSHRSIVRFRQAHPDRPVVVALTGTDLYRDLPHSAEAQVSLSLATRLVALQEAALDMLDGPVRSKTSVIYQSAEAPDQLQASDPTTFDVCVLSHLRTVKDPLRAAYASRLLPPGSKVRIVHAGRPLEPGWADAASLEQRENPRYRWIGEQSHESAIRLLARSRLFVLSSQMEGGANSIAEAVVCGVPVLCSSIPGNIGMLAPDYPGCFRKGDSCELAAMLHHAETDGAFLNGLRQRVHHLKDRFAPERELACWRELLQSLFA